jgi:hypothetical protein
MRRRLSATNSSTLCLTLGGELFEDIFPELKHRRYSKKKNHEILLVQKQIGHYDGCKMDYPKNYRQHKYPKYNITTKIIAKSQPTNREYEQ